MTYRRETCFEKHISTKRVGGISTHVWVERRPVGYTAAEVPHDADDDDARLQTGRPSLRTPSRHSHPPPSPAHTLHPHPVAGGPAGSALSVRVLTKKGNLRSYL